MGYACFVTYPDHVNKHWWKWRNLRASVQESEDSGTLARSDSLSTGRCERARAKTRFVSNITSCVSSHDFKHQVALGGEAGQLNQLEVSVATGLPAVSLIGCCS